MAFFFLFNWLDAECYDLLAFSNSITPFVTMFAGMLGSLLAGTNGGSKGHGRISLDLSVEEFVRCR
jgi:hypothetical protein